MALLSADVITRVLCGQGYPRSDRIVTLNYDFI